MKILTFILFFLYSSSYDRNGAVDYAFKYAEIPNHQCGNYDRCSPYSYWGNEACGYDSHGGDAPNFVSQCVVIGGQHPKLNTGEPCRGYPCGFEEIGVKNLGDCLKQFGWISICGYQESPPIFIEAGDVIIYHSDSCESSTAFSAIITEGGNNPKITSHSAIRINASYIYMDNSKPYYQWLHYNFCSDDTYYITDEICVSSCPMGTYLFPLNRTCLTTCPIYYIINNDRCVIKPFDKNTTLIEFKNQINSDIKLYYNSSNFIECSDFLAIISPLDKLNPEIQLENGISSFDLGNCTSIIKDYYDIPIEDNLIIVNIEKINEKYEQNIEKSTEILIYDYSGRQLNISVCKEDIRILKYISDIEKLDVESAESFSNQGIDVFNPADKFFNDICHPYDNPDRKDITLIDRRNDFYQNITFCQIGCTFTGINYTKNFANCICNTSFLQGEEDYTTLTTKESEKANFKTITKSFVENLLSFNIEVVKCYNLALNPKILVHNIGFYSLAIMLLLQVIFHIIYLIKKVKSLKSFMLKFIGQNKSNKNISIFNKNNKNKFNNNKVYNKKNYKNKFKVNSPPKNKKLKIPKVLNDKKTPKAKIYFKYNVFNYKDNELNNKESNSKTGIINSKLDSKNALIKRRLLNKLIKNNKSYTKRKSKLEKINKSEKISDKNKANLMNSKTNKEAIIKLSKSDYDLQDIDYDEAIIYDKRSYLRMYWGFLLDSQIILGTFFTVNHLDLFVIKLSFLVCTFQISFFLNALFYTDEYISDAYHNDGVLDFVSGLPKSIYSFVATLITTNLLRMLSNSKGELIEVITKRRIYKDYLHLIKIKLDKLRRKLIIYFILVYILELFFLYFVTAFCAVYRNSKKFWFFGCLESFGMDSLVALIICIFLALFRFISIKKHIKCFYVLANIISTFL